MSSFKESRARKTSQTHSEIASSYKEEKWVKRENRKILPVPPQTIAHLGGFNAFLRRHYVLDYRPGQKVAAELDVFCRSVFDNIEKKRRSSFEISSADKKFCQLFESGAYIFTSEPRPLDFKNREKEFKFMILSPHDRYGKSFSADDDDDVIISSKVVKNRDGSATSTVVKSRTVVQDVSFKDAIAAPSNEPHLNEPRDETAIVAREAWARSPHVPAPPPVRLDSLRADEFNIKTMKKYVNLLPSSKSESIFKLYRFFESSPSVKDFLLVRNSAFYRLCTSSIIKMSKEVKKDLISRSDLLIIPKRHASGVVPRGVLVDFFVSPICLPFAGHIFKCAQDLFNFMSFDQPLDIKFSNLVCTLLDMEPLSRADRLYLLEDVLFSAWCKRGHAKGRVIFRDFPRLPSARMVFTSDNVRLAAYGPRNKLEHIIQNNFTTGVSFESGTEDFLIYIAEQVPLLSKILGVALFTSEKHSFRTYVSFILVYLTSFINEADWKDFVHDELLVFSDSVRSLAGSFYESDEPSVVESDVFTAGVDLLSSLSVVSILSSLGVPFLKDNVKSWVSLITQHLKKDEFNRFNTVDAFVDKVYSFIRLLVNRMKVCIELRDFSLFFTSTPTLKDWLSWSDSVVHDECLRLDTARPEMHRAFLARKKDGAFPPKIVAPLDLLGRRNALLDLISLGEKLKLSSASLPHVLSVIRVKMDMLRTAERDVSIQRVNSAYRVVPFGIMICGCPGVGKTTFVSQIHSAIGAKIGLTNDETSMYRMDSNANYHDTFYGDMWGLLLDDIDQSQAPLTASVPSHPEIVNKLINSAPFPMEKADVSEKGKFFANFLSAYYLTNFPLANLRGNTMAPYQFWRRFPSRILMSVKPEYSTGSGSLDPEKVVSGERMFLYAVYKFAPKSPDLDFSTAPYVLLFTTDDPTKVVRHLLARFTDFNNKEKERLEDRIAGRLLDTCPYCHLAPSMHVNGAFCSSESFVYESAIYALVAGYTLCYFREYISSDWLRRVISNAVDINSLFAIARSLGYVSFVLASLQDFFGVTLPPFMNRLCDYLHGLSISFSDWVMSKVKKEWIEQLMSSKTIKIIGGLALTLPLIYAAWKRTTLSQGEIAVDSPSLPNKRDVWQRVAPVLWSPDYALRPKPTYTVEEMTQVLRSRLIRCRRGLTTIRGFMLCGGVALLPKHLFIENAFPDVRPEVSGPTDFSVWVGAYPEGEWVHLNLLPEDCVYVPGRDVVVARIIEIPVIKSKWNLCDELPRVCLASSRARADSAFMVFDDCVKNTDVRLEGVVGYAVSGSGHGSWSGAFSTEPGDCGLPLVATFGDRFNIVGFHGLKVVNAVGGFTLQERTLAESFSWAELSPIVNSISKRLGCSFEFEIHPTALGVSKELFSFTELPPKSSLGVAITQNRTFQGLILGTLPKCIGGVSMKTSIVPTLFRDDPFVIEHTSALFEEGDDFSPPIFRGRMNGEDWIDPHVRSLKNYLNRPGDSRLWLCAVNDYLEGMPKLHGWRSLVPLSIYSALIGVESTTVGAFNLKTSAGLPFFGNKRTCVLVEREGPVPEVFMNPKLQEQIDDILEVVERGDVYSPIAVHCLKDEAITKKKNALAKVRVFNVMGFAFNLLLKMYIAPLVSIFREHPLFFESAIGLNISGVADGLMVWEHLASFRNWMASDVSNFDVTASTQELYYSSIVVLSMARETGYSQRQMRILWGLLMSSIHVTHVIKGDVFFVNYTLASGYWITLFLNCIRNSLHSRYAFYALRPLNCTNQFRDVCHQFILGDDNIATVSDSVPWFNQVSIAHVLLEIGSVRSSSTKGAILTPYEDLSRVTFLKRSPTLLGKRRVWMIEEKTLWRMLNYRRISELSSHDHHCTILSVVLAEAWMYGEDRYNFFRELVLRLSSKHDLAGDYLRIPSYDEFLNRFDSGSLLVWDPFSTSLPE